VVRGFIQLTTEEEQLTSTGPGTKDQERTTLQGQRPRTSVPRDRRPALRSHGSHEIRQRHRSAP
jgi:hypothetical protein